MQQRPDSKPSAAGGLEGVSVLPKVGAENALFLDIDGTLLEIAATPDDVRVSAQLLETLRRLLKAFDGAVALVSGRALSDIDRLFPIDGLPIAALHGLVIRDGEGQVRMAPNGHELASLRASITAFAARWKGLRVEDKESAIAVHYRQAPEAAEQTLAFITDRVRDRDDLDVLRGKMVIELKPKSANKGSAIEDIMAEPPFQGRVPVFVGDDVTDEDGFAVVNRMGGYAIRVGAMSDSGARYQIADVPSVLDWLSRVATEFLDIERCGA